MSNNNRVVILMGPPAVGKGTLANKAIEQLGFVSLSTGQVFREHISSETDLGLMIKSAIDRGELVPNAVVDQVVQQWLAENCCCGKKIMFDGYPRTIEQAHFLVDLLLKNNLLQQSVVYILDADKTVIKDRVLGRIICANKNCGQIYTAGKDTPNYCEKCGNFLIKRKDDTLEVLENRLDGYFRVKQELISYFAAKGLRVISVDTTQKDQTQVFADFKENVGNKKA